MYCAKCGVKLADTEKRCPLCGTEAYHPDIERPEVDPLYPQDFIPKKELSRTTVEIILLTLFLIPLFTTLYCDIILNSQITWSGYAVFSLCLFYIIAVLPTWFRRPGPAVFVPIDFVCIALFLQYINFATNGDWFITFALPITAYLGITVTAFSVLLYYLKKGHLYVIGAFFIALGLFMDVIEYCLALTFDMKFFVWSIYPTIPLVLIGLALIAISISRAARAVLERKLHF